MAKEQTLHEEIAALVCKSTGQLYELVLSKLQTMCPTEQALIEFLQMTYADDLPPELQSVISDGNPKH